MQGPKESILIFTDKLQSLFLKDLLIWLNRARGGNLVMFLPSSMNRARGGNIDMFLLSNIKDIATVIMEQ